MLALTCITAPPTCLRDDRQTHQRQARKACRRIEQAYAQPRLFEDKVGAGGTAVQGDMLLPANAKVSGAGTASAGLPG